MGCTQTKPDQKQLQAKKPQEEVRINQEIEKKKEILHEQKTQKKLTSVGNQQTVDDQLNSSSRPTYNLKNKNNDLTINNINQSPPIDIRISESEDTKERKEKKINFQERKNALPSIIQDIAKENMESGKLDIHQKSQSQNKFERESKDYQEKVIAQKLKGLDEVKSVHSSFEKREIAEVSKNISTPVKASSKKMEQKMIESEEIKLFVPQSPIKQLQNAILPIHSVQKQRNNERQKIEQTKYVFNEQNLILETMNIRIVFPEISIDLVEAL